jgi:hypothetical protein
MSAGPSTELLLKIRDAIAFLVRKERLSRRCIDEAALAAIIVIERHRRARTAANRSMDTEGSIASAAAVSSITANSESKSKDGTSPSTIQTGTSG